MVGTTPLNPKSAGEKCSPSRISVRSLSDTRCFSLNCFGNCSVVLAESILLRNYLYLCLSKDVAWPSFYMIHARCLVLLECMIVSRSSHTFPRQSCCWSSLQPSLWTGNGCSSIENSALLFLCLCYTFCLRIIFDLIQILASLVPIALAYGVKSNEMAGVKSEFVSESLWAQSAWLIYWAWRWSA